MTATMDIALVTRHRPESLERTLVSLREQSEQPARLLISDDSTEAGAIEANRALAARYGGEYFTGPRAGLYANRNSLAKLCTATHMRTCDDDHEFAPGHIAACHAAIRTDPESVWVIGEHHPWTEDLSASPTSPGQLDASGYSAPPADPDRSWVIADGCTIYPMSIFRQGVAYADCFKFGASYLEFGARLHWLGYRIRHLPETWVLHHLDYNARSFSDPAIEVASRTFAMLCFSMLYQPSLPNRLRSARQLASYTVKHGPRSAGWIRRGLAEYRRHRSAMLTLRQELASRGEASGAGAYREATA